MKYAFLLLFFLLGMKVSHAQIQPIGFWRDHVSMQQIISVDTLQQKIIAASSNGFFFFDPVKNEFSTYTKSSGLSDVNISIFSRQPNGSKIILGYHNGNIDVVTDGNIRNLPEIMLSKVTSEKKINSIIWKDKLAFICTNFGVVVIDPFKFEIVDTYFPGSDGKPIEVYDIAFIGSKSFVATNEGIRVAETGAIRLSDFRSWSNYVSFVGRPFIKYLKKWGDYLIGASSDTVFSNVNGNWKEFYLPTRKLNNIQVIDNALYLYESENNNASIISFLTPTSKPRVFMNDMFTEVNACIIDGSNFWAADANNGLLKLSGNSASKIFPNGPAGIANGLSDYKNGLLVAVAGEKAVQTTGKRGNEIYTLKDDKWKNYTPIQFSGLSKLADFSAAAVDPSTDNIYIGTLGNGVLNIEPNDKLNTLGLSAGQLQSDRDEAGLFKVPSLAFDVYSNLWMTNPNTNNPIVVKKKDGSWKSFGIPFPIEKNQVNKILVDAQNRKWITTSNAEGLICFDDNNSIDATGDDRWRIFLAGTGSGNLPSSNVLSVAEDQSGNIWVGTDKGIGIIQCGSDVFRNCDATLPIVQQDNFAGLLLANETVYDIKIDGADRKWIASQNGAWLLSADGQKVIYRFTAENSKLLSNLVYSMVINGNTGEVFFMTSGGISSFRSTATEASEQKKKPIVFPNPVPTGYTGTIGIRDLPLNAWVKITELDGRLVYQTRALGGQAIWNGKNYKGERVNSGVYLIIVSSQDNSNQVAGKIFFIK
ncbi:MAG: two-component regulator propeller domain-containing protein [Chitinophagaceae bacterium]